MKRFTYALAFSISLLLVLSLWLFGPSVKAKEDPILTLLNLPAPPPINPLVTNTAGTRSQEFYDKENPPPDNAPIEDLMDYWSRQSTMFQELGYNPKPSDAVMNRLFNEIEKDPKRIGEFLNVMQDNKRAGEIAEDAYEKLGNASDDEARELRRTLKQWLTRNTDKFSDDLRKAAATVGDVGEYVSNQDELLALAHVDWEKASPIVNRLYGDGTQKVSKVLATWALYKRALDSDSIGDIDRYRDELKAVVENKEATDAMRDLALDALIKEKEWGGRDEWYYSLMGDETLHELTVDGRVYTGLTTLMYYTQDDRYVDRLLQYAGSGDIWVRTAAVKNLLLRLSRLQDLERNKKLRADIVRAVLPWLGDPKWIKENRNRRLEIVRALQTVKMPDAVPALISALDEKDVSQTTVYVPTFAANSNIAVYRVNPANAANMAATAANLASNGATYSGTLAENVYYPFRSNAVIALETQADGRAAPALRRVLTQVEEYERSATVKALLACNGFSIDEQAEAIEFVARNAGDPFNETAPADPNSLAGRSQQAMRSVLAASRSVVKAEEEEEEESSDQEFDNYGAPSRPEPTETADFPGTDYDAPKPGPLSSDDIKFLVGSQLISIEDVSDDLIRTIADRITQYDKRDPVLAEALRQVMLFWNGRAVNTLLLRDLKAGRVDAEAIVKLLSVRKYLRENQGADVSDIRNGSAAARGIAPCLLEDPSSFDAILENEDEAAKTAALACARLIRSPLPVAKIAAFLKSRNKLLALAAERYLESEDSPEARAAVLAQYPNQAKIVGATTSFEVGGTQVTPGKHLSNLFASVNPYFGASEYSYATFGYDGEFSETERRIQNEFKSDPNLLGVYSYDDNFIHIYGDRAVFSWSDDPARYRERVLEQSEFENLKSYLSHFHVDQLPPFLACVSECEARELLMVGRSGGRRVFEKSDVKRPEFFAGLEEIFLAMRHTPGKLKYYAGGLVPGLEVLFADEARTARTVWKNGADLRVLLMNKDQDKAVQRDIDRLANEAESEGAEAADAMYSKFYRMRETRKFESYGWYRLIGENVGDAAPQPDQAEFIPARDGNTPSAAFGQWKAKAAGIEIRSDETGLYRIAGGRTTRLRQGNFSDPVITANGRWVIASNFNEDTGGSIVRINLVTGRMTRVAAADVGIAKAICYVPSINRVLLAGYGEDEHDHGGDSETYNSSAEDSGRGYYLLNPDTGVVTAAAGEVRPLAQQSFRALQPTGNPGEFWAALPRGTAGTIVGVYSTTTFTLKPLLKLPKIIFDSTEMWVDGGKVYFVYEGHLLSAPLSASVTPNRPS